MTSGATVSIVMPCFKAEKTLLLAVAGVQAQSYQRWELLIVVDGLHDESATLAQQLAAQDSRVRVFLSEKKRGVVRARNLGIRLAKGEWLAFCDADDFWQPNKLEAQLQLAQSKKSNLLCSTFWFWYPNRQQRTTQLVKLPKKLVYATMLRTNAIPMSTAMYHLPSLGKQYFIALPKGFIHEDYAYWLRVMSHPQVHAHSLSVPTTYIRIQANSRSANKWQAMRSHAYILKSVAGLSLPKRSLAMLAYLSWAIRKRLSRQYGQEQPTSPLLTPPMQVS